MFSPRWSRPGLPAGRIAEIDGERVYVVVPRSDSVPFGWWVWVRPDRFDSVTFVSIRLCSFRFGSILIDSIRRDFD